MTTVEARALLLALLPDGYDRWFDLRAPDPSKPGDTGSDAWRIVDGAAEQLALRVFTPAEQAALDANPTTMGAIGLAAWESALGLTASRIATQGTTTQRAAQVIARLREYGLPTLANIKAALAAIAGYVPTILEHDRATLTTANTRVFLGLPVTIPASASVEVDVFVPDNGWCSRMGAQLLVTITHPQVQSLVASLISPDGRLATWTSLGTGSVTSQRYVLSAVAFAGGAAGGLWRAFIFDGSGNAGTWVAGAGDGIFVEGVNRSPSGADGYGSRIFEWSAMINESLVAASSYDRAAVIQTSRRWNPAFCDGGVALVQTDGTIGALCDDPNCLADLCVASS